MSEDVRLWLIRHAPVVGPMGVIHGVEAPADTGDETALAALRAKLPHRSEERRVGKECQ